MKTHMTIAAIAVIALLSAAAHAQPASQQEHQEHHPDAAAQSKSPPPANPSTEGQAKGPAGQMPMGQMPMGQMMQNMPEQCRDAMKENQQNCMQMMQGQSKGMPSMKK